MMPLLAHNTLLTVCNVLVHFGGSVCQPTWPNLTHVHLCGWDWRWGYGL